MIIMMNKPKGYLTARSDRTRATIMELLPPELRHLHPIGRLEEADFDRMAAGVVLEGTGVTSLPARAWLEGYSTIGARETLLPPKKHNHLMKNPQRPVTEGWIAVREGRKHQVKLMVKAVGGHVFTLKRTSFGGLELDPELSPGQFRELTEEEIGHLFTKE